MKQSNKISSLLKATFMRGVYLTVATLFVSLSLSIPAQAQEKPEVKYVQVGDAHLNPHHHHTALHHLLDF